MHWDEPADSLLAKLWNAGGSLESIADALIKAGYTDVTRNAIAGRKHRLPSELFQRPSKTGQSTRVSIAPARVVIQQQQQPVQKPKPAAHTGPKVQYLKTTDDMCKALLDERGGRWNLPMVCGRRRMAIDDGRSSYCKHHHALYYPVHNRR